MPAKARKPKWYAWALRLREPKYAGYVDERRLWLVSHSDNDGATVSDDWPRVLRGVELAQELASLAERRRNGKLLWEGDPREWDQETPTPVQRFDSDLPRVISDVKHARQALFGSIGDRAIRHRLGRFAQQSMSDPRYCTMAGCHNALPQRSRSTRKRCDACREAGRRR